MPLQTLVASINASCLLNIGTWSLVFCRLSSVHAVGRYPNILAQPVPLLQINRRDSVQLHRNWLHLHCAVSRRRVTNLSWSSKCLCAVGSTLATGPKKQPLFWQRVLEGELLSPAAGFKNRIASRFGAPSSICVISQILHVAHCSTSPLWLPWSGSSQGGENERGLAQVRPNSVILLSAAETPTEHQSCAFILLGCSVRVGAFGV